MEVVLKETEVRFEEEKTVIAIAGRLSLLSISSTGISKRQRQEGVHEDRP